MEILLFVLFLACCGAAASTGAMFQPGAWYDALAKPRWTPPNWVFPVVWSILYLLIAASAARVAGQIGSQFAMAFWALQIALNTLWTPVFFGLRRIKAGMWIICLLWIAVAGAMLTAWFVDELAGILLVPYLLWVTIAAALNASVWSLNRDEANKPAAAQL